LSDPVWEVFPLSSSASSGGEGWGEEAVSSIPSDTFVESHAFSRMHWNHEPLRFDGKSCDPNLSLPEDPEGEGGVRGKGALKSALACNIPNVHGEEAVSASAFPPFGRPYSHN